MTELENVDGWNHCLEGTVTICVALRYRLLFHSVQNKKASVFDLVKKCIVTYPV